MQDRIDIIDGIITQFREENRHCHDMIVRKIEKLSDQVMTMNASLSSVKTKVTIIGAAAGGAVGLMSAFASHLLGG